MVSFLSFIRSHVNAAKSLLSHSLWGALLLVLLMGLHASCGPDSPLTETTEPVEGVYVDAVGELPHEPLPEPPPERESVADAGGPEQPVTLSDEMGPREATPTEPVTPEVTPDAFDFGASLQAFASKYQLALQQKPSFPVQTRHGEINGKVAATVDIEAYAKIFFPEWALYPPALIKKIGLKSVAFCTDLSFAGQYRSAIPDMENHVLYLDVKRGFYNVLYVRRTIHHELFHFIDFYDDWKLYQDDEWAALNPKGFSYQNGGKNAQDQAKASLVTEDHPGFFTSYSLSGVEEDKAEVFSVMVVLASVAADRAKKDPIIAAKIARMKALLVRFVPEVDERFWKATAALPRSF